jgi:hypothetical protein
MTKDRLIEVDGIRFSRGVGNLFVLIRSEKRGRSNYPPMSSSTAGTPDTSALSSSAAFV